MEYNLNHLTKQNDKIDTICEVTISRVYLLNQKEFLLEFQSFEENYESGIETIVKQFPNLKNRLEKVSDLEQNGLFSYSSESFEGYTFENGNTFLIVKFPAENFDEPDHIYFTLKDGTKTLIQEPIKYGIKKLDEDSSFFSLSGKFSEFQIRIRNMSQEIQDELLKKLNNPKSMPFENDFNIRFASSSELYLNQIIQFKSN